MSHAHHSHRALERAEAGTPPPTPREERALATLSLQNEIAALQARSAKLRAYRQRSSPSMQQLVALVAKALKAEYEQR